VAGWKILCPASAHDAAKNPALEQRKERREGFPIFDFGFLILDFALY
jgi:hypothetical protein